MSASRIAFASAGFTVSAFSSGPAASFPAASMPNPSPAARTAARPRVLITRPAAQAEDLSLRLDEAGFAPITIPTLAIQPLPDTTALDEALRALASFQYLIFSSANAARITGERLAALGITPRPGPGAHVVAGAATARALAKIGLRADIVPSPFSAEAVLESLAGHPLAGARVFLPRALEGREALGAGLQERGADVTAVPVYHTVPATELPPLIEVLSKGTLAAVSLFSPSAVTGFANALRAGGMKPDQLPGRPRVVCIGPTTAAAAQAAGLTVDAIARDTTAAAVVEALVSLLATPPPIMSTVSPAATPSTPRESTSVECAR